MTIDDENSIYVGGLPYDSTEETLREAFHYYGSVVAIKIINDRDVGGKSYGFVTFTNPKSADNAIHEMNGKTIAGRVVRVNEARTRGGRPNFHRENNFFRDSERDVEWDRGSRDRDRTYDHDRVRYRDRNDDRSRERDREREFEHLRDHVQTRERFSDRDRDQDREDNGDERNRRSHDQDSDKDHDLDLDRYKDVRSNDGDRTKDRDKDQRSTIRNRPHFNNRHSREQSSNSSDDYHDLVKEQLEISNQRHEELQKEISQIEEKSKEKEQLVSDLRKKSLQLEDALATAKKLSSHRKMQLTKLQRCSLQVKDFSEKLKASEQELQALVDTTMIEASMGDVAS